MIYTWRSETLRMCPDAEVIENGVRNFDIYSEKLGFLSEKCATWHAAWKIAYFFILKKYKNEKTET